jgi:hypothetical protein
METKSISCDGCEKPLDPLKDHIEFKPLRGGLAVNTRSGDQLKVKQVTRTAHFHDGTCVTAWAKKEEPKPQAKPDAKPETKPEAKPETKA